MQLPECELNVYDITERTFFVGVHSKGLPVKSQREFALFASYTLSHFLMAINVATLGHFDWATKTNPMASYSIVDNLKKEASGIVSLIPYKYPEEARQPITEGFVNRAAMLLFAIASEEKKYIRTEYLKGIYHLGLNFFDLQFQKDAFANFYRSFEYFVTDRILKQSRLNNELKDIKRALNLIGVSDDIIEMFSTELYPLRSEQVMHSQKHQTEIEWDQAIKMKMVADIAMHHHYKSVWEIND